MRDRSVTAFTLHTSFYRHLVSDGPDDSDGNLRRYSRYGVGDSIMPIDYPSLLPLFQPIESDEEVRRSYSYAGFASIIGVRFSAVLHPELSRHVRYDRLPF